jgi:Tol biopolymer transport system component
MSGNPEDAWLIALGSAVSDGSVVDWEHAEQHATDPDQRRLVQQLRELATVVSAHRSGAVNPDERGESQAALVTSASQWRHLVLFECIGAGAFGKVYRGWDPQLDREVAVKLLPKATAGAMPPLDEARHLARIRHSNVVVVYGADQDDEQVGIWMEYIEGHTLAAMVREHGPMSPREVSGIGLDLCHALSALHAAGLLHRDIKAHNVMREVGGRIVLMDFSGAQAIKAQGASKVLLGTPLYMAPELFDGSAATPASDVYSIGVLLFFLLSGGLPVEGSTLEDVKQSHSRRHRKRLRDVRPDLPDGVVQVIERATAHEPDARYQTAGELEHALASASGARAVLGSAVASTSKSGRAARRWPVWAAAGVLLALAAAAAAFGRWMPSRPAIPVTRFTIGPPYVSGSWPRISPDGRLVVFGATVEGRNRFWIRPLDSVTGRALISTTANETPFWSPDSRTLCFFADGKLNKISLDGGDAQVLAEAPQSHGGDWFADTIIFARNDGIYRITPNGGTAERLTTLDEAHGEYQHGWPEFLPDGRRFLYIIQSSRAERTGLYVSSLDGSAPRRVMPAFSRSAYADGHLLFVREGTLLAQPFDPHMATPRGEPVALAARVQHHPSSDAAFDVSTSGVLIHGGTPGRPSTRLMLFDRQGRELRALTDVRSFAQPRFSPDGNRVVAMKVERDEDNPDIWVYGITRPSSMRLTRPAAGDVKPVWSPDGLRIAFSSKRGDLFHIYSKTVDSAGGEQPLVTTAGDKFVEHWSPDSRYLTATILKSGLWVLPLGSGDRPRMIRAGDAVDTWQSEFSPDGRWLAYMSSESGKPEVYVEPFPSTGVRWQVSTQGGAEPHWRGDSKELLYLSADRMLTAVTVSGTEWKPSKPQPLFRVTIPDLTGDTDYTVSPDGRFLVVNTFIAEPRVPPIDVVLNWTALLAR